MLYIPNETGSSPDPGLLTKLYFWKSLSRWAFAGVVIPPLFGIAQVAFSYMRSFNKLANTEGGAPSLTQYTVDISRAGENTMWCLIASGTAGLILIVAVIRVYSLRKRCFGSQ